MELSLLNSGKINFVIFPDGKQNWEPKNNVSFRVDEREHPEHIVGVRWRSGRRGRLRT